MLNFPDIDPVAVQFGPLGIRWYGIMYLLGFAIAWMLARYRIRKGYIALSKQQRNDLIFYGMLGVILGGRLGYVLLYQWSIFVQDPLILFKIWQGGMSFHGGFVGVIVSTYIYSRKLNMNFSALLDFVAPCIPPGLGLGRLGNFIGGELWGRATDLPWAMVFPHAGQVPRHPSQLYQGILEGVVLFMILWWFSSKKPPRMAVSALFLLCYGSFRFLVEFVREPDQHIGFIAFNWMTMGQLLSLCMIIPGLWLLYWSYHRSSGS